MLAESRTRLSHGVDGNERALELGKIQNLRVAARRLNGVLIPAGETFSFWAQVGRCTRPKGYVAGRQLQEGCLVPAVGGGICQLSNALYETALAAGCQILERHPHTRVIPGSAAERGQDATVAYNHIDLRWVSQQDLYLRVTLSNEELSVQVWGKNAVQATPPARTPLSLLIAADEHACGDCDQTSCFRFHSTPQVGSSSVAVLVDEVWPEFDGYLREISGPNFSLFVPLDGKRRGRAAYAWSTDGYGAVQEALLPAVLRSLRARRLAHQGAERQRARLKSFEALARSFSRRIPVDCTHAIVSLDLLPFLWETGALGGRSFDVLMTRFPLKEIHARLDRAIARNPERALLGDFRAPVGLLQSESDALAAAARLVTPHTAVAKGDSRRVLLPWSLPAPKPHRSGDIVLFPGPSAARKGAYEVREAARRSGLRVAALGSALEGGDFWAGLDAPAPKDFEGVLAVVLPAVLEDRPRRVLSAIASGCPVIATEACGVSGMPGVILVPDGNVDAIVRALEELSVAAEPDRAWADSSRTRS